MDDHIIIWCTLKYIITSYLVDSVTSHNVLFRLKNLRFGIGYIICPIDVSIPKRNVVVYK